MWQALVTVCLIQSMSECLILEDQGWHESEMRCQKRALEMAGDVHKYLWLYKPTFYQCRKLAGGMLTK
tara:strand:+ start:1041 stop:1244 length:204 start_codon:yes stop_codon:yes gene_type:complete